MRCTFEDRILMSDLVFLRAWTKVEVPRFFNPLTTALQPRDQTWQGMRTVAELRRENNIPVPVNKDSLYRVKFLRLSQCAPPHPPSFSPILVRIFPRGHCFVVHLIACLFFGLPADRKEDKEVQPIGHPQVITGSSSLCFKAQRCSKKKEAAAGEPKSCGYGTP